MSHRTIIIAAAALLAVTCSREAAPGGAVRGAVLVPEVTVGAPASKSIVGGSTLEENGRTYGLFLCRAGDPSHGAWGSGLYMNMRAVYGGGWRYASASSPTETFSPLNIVTDDVSETFDLFCYSPWRDGAEVGGGLSYDLSSVAEGDYTDIMYATYEDAQGDPANLSVAVADGATLSVPVRFRHALSRIVIHLRLAQASGSGYDGSPSMRLRRAELLRSAGASTPLYTRGEMDLLTGAVTPSQAESDSVQAVTCDAWVGSASSWTSTSMLVHPQECLQDGDLLLRLYFDGTDAAHALRTDYALRRSDLMHSDGVTCGFRAGHSYHLRFGLQEYIHLEGAHVSGDWADGGETGVEI